MQIFAHAYPDCLASGFGCSRKKAGKEENGLQFLEDTRCHLAWNDTVNPAFCTTTILKMVFHMCTLKSGRQAVASMDLSYMCECDLRLSLPFVGCVAVPATPIQAEARKSSWVSVVATGRQRPVTKAWGGREREKATS